MEFGPRIGDRLFRQPQTHGDGGVAVEREPLLITDGSEKERFPSIRLSRVSQSARTGFLLVALQTQCLKIQQEGRLFVAIPML